MQLKISNVGKIEAATINIDGITVIAGENNAGKSTIGKLLFAIFNSMNNMDNKIAQERRNNVYNIISTSLQGRLLQRTDAYPTRARSIHALAERLTNNLMTHLNDASTDHIGPVLQSALSESSFFATPTDMEDFIDECGNRLNALFRISDDKVMTEVISRLFNRVFAKQISPLREDGLTSNIELTIKDKKISYLFNENTCTDWSSDINLLHQAFYIDNPFIIDDMSEYYRNEKITETHLLSFLCQKNDNIFDGIFDTVMAKDKLNEIYAVLGEVIEGDIEENQDGKYCFKSSKYAHPLNVSNLSTGLKSFALIKKLLENGSIKEKDVLILDEPEIHLHPEWQLLYAKLIVLLQKEFNLSMVITTHSPYFLDAIDVYSTQYDTAHTTHYYLAENEGNVATLRNVTDNIDAIYKKLSDPMQILENLRYHTNVE